MNTNLSHNWRKTVLKFDTSLIDPFSIYTGTQAQMVKNLPAMHETWVQSLGQEDPLEKKMATHSSILAWETSWIEEPGGLQSMESQRMEHD